MRFNEFSVKAITYHDTLNPILWDNNELIPEIKSKLLSIAKHFSEYVKLKNIKDITISGSNASYGYSEYSDIDLHVIIDIDPAFSDLYSAKKNEYNSKYNIKIKDIDVELYVQDSKETHYSAGIYSILNNKWLVKPKHELPKVSEKEVRSKARNYSGKINSAIRSNDLNIASNALNDIRKLRKAGLETGGEESVENCAYKLLRNRGRIEKLQQHITNLTSKGLSLY